MKRIGQLTLIANTLALIGTSVTATAETIYSENFDSGTPGQSLLDPQYGFTINTDPAYPGPYDMHLAPSQHGWTGNSIIGSAAAEGQSNELEKFLPMPEHGVIKFSADLYAFAQDGGVGIRLRHGTSSDPDPMSFSVGGGFYGFWESSCETEPRGIWDSPIGMHDVPVHVALYWNQDTGENWAEVSDGVSMFASPHNFHPGSGPMNAIDLAIDRRYSNVGGDIDNLKVEAFPVPEPASLGAFGIGIAALAFRFLRR